MRVVPSRNGPTGAEQAPVTAMAVAISILASGIQALLWLGRPAGASLRSDWELSCTLSSSGLLAGEWWRVFTFPLLHEGALHALAGAAGIAIVGRCVEPIIGGIKLLILLLTGSAVGGLVHCASTSYGLVSDCMIVGTFPAFFALVGAYGTLIPDWPVGAASRWGGAKMRARHASWLALGCAIALWASGLFPEVGPAAMATATVVGWWATRAMGFGDILFYEQRVKPHCPEATPLREMSWNDFVASQLDPVLEKIARRGIKSLTRAERGILRAGQKRLLEGSDPP